MATKKHVFFFHYNKPLSRAMGKPMITVHFRGRCLVVENLVCEVPTKGRINKRQPFFVVTGKAHQVSVANNVAHIV